MIKTYVLIVAVMASFCLGFAFKSILANDADNKTALKRVTGIGGIFFKCKEPKKLR